jgi:hypothetical protein
MASNREAMIGHDYLAVAPDETVEAFHKRLEVELAFCLNLFRLNLFRLNADFFGDSRCLFHDPQPRKRQHQLALSFIEPKSCWLPSCGMSRCAGNRPHTKL